MSIDWPDWTAGNVNVAQLAGANSGFDLQTTDVNALPVAGAETILLTTAAITVQTNPALVLIVAWCQTQGSGGTFTYAIRRGTAITDPLVGEANAEAAETGGGGALSGQLLVRGDLLFDVTSVQYIYTVTQSVAATVFQSSLMVAVF